MLFDIINLKYHIAEQRVGMHILHILLGLLWCTGYSTVDAFRGNQNTAFYPQVLTVLQMLLRKRFRVFNLHELII